MRWPDTPRVPLFFCCSAEAACAMGYLGLNRTSPASRQTSAFRTEPHCHAQKRIQKITLSRIMLMAPTPIAERNQPCSGRSIGRCTSGDCSSGVDTSGDTNVYQDMHTSFLAALSSSAEPMPECMLSRRIHAIKAGGLDAIWTSSSWPRERPVNQNATLLWHADLNSL